MGPIVLTFNNNNNDHVLCQVLNISVVRDTGNIQLLYGFKGAHSMTIYLYVKTHSITGLKYLGKTEKSNPHKYTGSGVYWKRHLKKYGKHYNTEILCECQTEDELSEKGLYYSTLWNVVENEGWANLKEETGTGGKLSEETKSKISSSNTGKTNIRAKGGHWWNNGIDQYQGHTPPNDTYIRGRLNFNNVGAIKGTEIQKGKIWINNGINEMMIFPNDEIPYGFIVGRTIGEKNKGLNTWAKGSKWWNNGTTTKIAVECPGPDWILGRRLRSPS